MTLTASPRTGGCLSRSRCPRSPTGYVPGEVTLPLYFLCLRPIQQSVQNGQFLSSPAQDANRVVGGGPRQSRPASGYPPILSVNADMPALTLCAQERPLIWAPISQSAEPPQCCAKFLKGRRCCAWPAHARPSEAALRGHPMRRAHYLFARRQPAFSSSAFSSVA